LFELTAPQLVLGEVVRGDAFEVRLAALARGCGRRAEKSIAPKMI
jgi:hypothetical protein